MHLEFINIKKLIIFVNEIVTHKCLILNNLIMNSSDKESVQYVKKQFKDIWNLDLKITSNKFSQEDLWFYYNDKKHSVEVKRRRFNSNQYPTTIIEKSKYEYLLKNNGILVVVFNDCWIVIKDLRKAFVRESQKLARKTTDFNNQNWVIKDFIELNFNDLIKYAIR